MEFCMKARQGVKLCFDSGETEAVKIAIDSLEQDLKKVLPKITVIKECETKENREIKREESDFPVIVIKTIAQNEVQKTEEWMLDEKGTLRKEAYQWKIQDSMLFITGTDRRGTIYGIYSFCEWMGVSPWYFFADVPVKEKSEVVLLKKDCRVDYPSVEYRGIFINDEEELESWVKKCMGEPTIGVKTYKKIFELLLRLKANYIWPAMHVNSFNITPENGVLADKMGIVVGTSHCDMLMRSNNCEWKPWLEKKGYTDAVYDYSIEGRNREILEEYWRESAEQNCNYEVCYTLGMRGIHDSGFETRGILEKSKEDIRRAKIALLEKIIADQRKILKNTLKHKTMMTFIPYKEVLELYDNGLCVPEDMTLVWANDNYGYIRRFPSEKEKKRSGGNGIYYHNSYWAPPSMSYVFLCSIPLAHTKNELRKAWEEGIRKLWVLNCGAIKPLEQEITFFLQLAWEIGKYNIQEKSQEDFEIARKDAGKYLEDSGEISVKNIESYDTKDVEVWVKNWIDRMFTGNIGSKVSKLLNDFSQLTNVRKLENMDYDAFSQTAYGDEAAMRIHKYEEMFAQGNALYEKLPEKEKAAFFQIVLMRIHAAYFTNLSWYCGDRSTLMYERGNMQAAKFYSEKTKEAEDSRRRMLHYYNHVLCGGKWNGILDPEGFPPPRASMMPVYTPPLEIVGAPKMRVDLWNQENELVFASLAEKWIEIGNTGGGEFTVNLSAPEWVNLSEKGGVVREEKRILIRVSDISEERAGEIVIENMQDKSIQKIPIRTVKTKGAENGILCEGSFGKDDFKNNKQKDSAEKISGICAVEEDGLVGVEAAAAQSKDFRRIRRLGRMQGDLMEACVKRELKQEADGQESIETGAEPLCYPIAVQSTGEFLMEIHRFPSLNSVGRLRIGISVDHKPIQIAESFSNDEWRGNWKQNVLDNVDRLYIKLPLLSAGKHQLFVWALDQYFAFSRLVIYTKERKKNNLAGIRNTQPLPEKWELLKWCDQFYGEYCLPPRPVFLAPKKNVLDGLAVTCKAVQENQFGEKIEPSWYLKRGSMIFKEKYGEISIDAAAALAQSSYAWTNDGRKVEQSGKLWQHCGSESFGRSGLAMYIRTPKLSWKISEAPSLNFRFLCGGGSYTLWMLSKFNFWEEGVFAVGLDNQPLPAESLYGNGRLWCYEAEQIYRWIPAAGINLEKGEHLLCIYALASGMRFDRFYLTNGSQEPPLDSVWIKG